MHLCGCLGGFFSNQQLSGRRVPGRRHAGSICFHILHRLSARSRGVTLQKSPASRAFPTCNSDFCSARSDFSCVRGSSNTTQGVSRHACHQFHSGSGSDHVDRRRGHRGLPSPETTGGTGIHRRRFHHWPAHPAIRPDPRRRNHQDPGRARCDIPDVLPGPGVQPAQVVQGRCHGIHRGIPGNRADDLDRLRDRSLV
ncbi:hypothetical protein D3C80_323520 [compost metagenome]